MLIQLYGTPSVRYNKIRRDLLNLQSELGIVMSLKEINDIDDIISEGIKEVPSIKINDLIIPCGNEKSISEILENASIKIQSNKRTPSMKRFLFPFDITNDPPQLLEYGASIAASSDMSMTVLYAGRPLTLVPEGSLSVYDVEEHTLNMKNSLSDIIEKVSATYPNAQIDIKTKIGFAGDAIMDESEDYDLIVMGSRRKSNSFLHWLGSVSRHTVLNAKVPVLVIPYNVKNGAIKRLMYGWHKPSTADNHIKSLIEFSKAIDASLSFVHINNDVNDDNVDDLASIKQYMSQKYPDQGISYIEYKATSIEEGLIEVAKQSNSDVIALTKTNKSLWKYIKEGSHTEALLKLSDQPVLILHENT